MMVLFVSQCEKKALARTRRVLDAFADRIGDNTWQTVITQEGLLAVKKLLRKTASKNTAVSCHWIRSRARSDLLWIVGNKNKFNRQGVVPVNSTGTDVFMDVRTMKAKENEFYANTQLQLLSEHLFAVGYLALRLFEKVLDHDGEHEKLGQTTFLAGLVHDLGKIEPEYQTWVKKGKLIDDDDGQHIETGKFTFEKHPRHNEVSLLLINIFEASLTELNPAQKIALQHVVYWHHAKPYRKKDDFTSSVKFYDYLLKNTGSEKFNKVLDETVNILGKAGSIANQYSDNLKISNLLNWSLTNAEEQLEAFKYRFDGKNLPDFKHYKLTDNFSDLRQSIEVNAHHNIIRACVISADRIISRLRADDLSDYVKNKRLEELIDGEISSNLSLHIENALKLFPNSERTNKQAAVAKELSEVRDIAVLAGAAGCGKTKIALEWAKLNNAQKVFWICPRVQICQGIFDELNQNYLPDANIEIVTGEFKYTNGWDKPTEESDLFSGDIVVTTIDQILGSITTHTDVDALIPFIEAHVIFDEFHEYVNMEIFNLLFAELIANKNMRPAYNKRTLLVSATPQYAFLEQVLDIDKNYDVIEMPSFNPSSYQIQFIELESAEIAQNPLFAPQPCNTFVICNTAQDAQLSFLLNKDIENGVLFHSKFKKNDKRNIFESIYDSFKKEGTSCFDILRSGPIVQASLNISCDHMVSEMTGPENMLQRLGRLDRFGKNDTTNTLTVPISESVKNGKQIDSSSRFLARLNQLQSAKAWYLFLVEKVGERSFTLPELYKLYAQFYESSIARKEVSSDLEGAVKKSIELLNAKVTEPVKVIKSKTEKTSSKIKKNSLRGDSRFVQLEKINLNDILNPVFTNEYAYSIPVEDGAQIDNLTESTARIKDLGLLTFMAQKHVNVEPSHPVKKIPKTKMRARELMLENYARNPEYPLYLSYTQDDLDQVGGSDVRHSEAIYYGECDQQPVGLISIKLIKELCTNNIRGLNDE